ncbi:MAG: acyltransferase family protein, partial [Planctomycetota bacterium]
MPQTLAEVSTSSPSTISADSSGKIDRRHDLDALRAVAMLLGIVLHAALSFAPIPWMVSDSQQNGLFEILFACIHGFRMPLFFLLSGFFTAMLWRKRGLGSLICQRAKRIALPLFVCCLTILPLMWAVIFLVNQPAEPTDDGVYEAVISGDIERLRDRLAESNVDVNVIPSGSGSSPLSTAVFLGHTEMVELLVASGADVNVPNPDLATPLHIACFMGRAASAKILLQSGANTSVLNGTGQTPADVLETDFGTTQMVAGQFGVQLDEIGLRQGRAEIAKQLGVSGFQNDKIAASVGFSGLSMLLFHVPVFMHLWFLWFLCWFLILFLVYVPIANVLAIRSLPRWLLCSPLSLFWLIPLTMLPQSFMAPTTFGPDSSGGLLPIPSVFFYYSIFFFLGAVYWDVDDVEGKLGRSWFVVLPIALFGVFPIGLDVVTGQIGVVPSFENRSTQTTLGNFLQATFTWLTIFGLIGLFRAMLSDESKRLRYLSDASYWLYLAHLPLVLVAQWLVRDWPIPSFVKFVGVTIA